MESRNFFHEYLVIRGKNEEIFITPRKFLSRNIYFGTGFKKSRKFGAIRYQDTGLQRFYCNVIAYTVVWE